MTGHASIFLAALLLGAAPAWAEERDFCADRPGLGTPACTLSPGQVMVEAGAVNWDHSADLQSVTDTVTYGETLVRIGLTERSEVQIEQGGYGTERVRDRASGRVTRDHGAGDLYLAYRHGLGKPGGPVAIEGFVTLPVGRQPIGAGDWGAGLLLPAGIDLPANFELDLTPEVDAAVNASGSGRHLAFGGVFGIAHPLGKAISVTAELSAFRDDDPSGHTTDTRAAGSLAWQAGKDVQIDLEADVGLTAAAPRHSVIIGVARRF